MKRLWRRFRQAVVELGERAFGGGLGIVAILLTIVLLYTVICAVRFKETDGDEIGYPQQVLAGVEYQANPGSPLPEGGAASTSTTSGTSEGPCAPSYTVRMLTHILDVLVNENLWIPGDPQFKTGWFGLVSFEDGPIFDNEASFQLGALRAVRRVSVELVDLLGRARGTSGVDEDLAAARGALFVDERAWRINPFDSKLPFIATPARVAYREATGHLQSYDARLGACEALFDSRSDNLFLLLDRIANDIGGMTDTLARRSKGQRWSVAEKKMVPGEGNDWGLLDFQADNLFHVAHGQMWAYHGILQALRVDFGNTDRQSNLGQVWDRLERHIAETAALDPLIVSNGREDSVFQPDHLSIMAVNMLRARANLTELREILNR